MARKGLWQRLFGGDEPDKDKPDTPEPTPPQPPADETTDPQPADIKPADPQRDERLRHDNPADTDTPETDTDVPTPRQDGETKSPDTQGMQAEPETGEVEPEPADPAPESRPVSETTLPQTAELKTDAVGRVYAGALLELAHEAGQVEPVTQEVHDLLPLVESGGDLHRLLTHPAISADERGKIVSRVFEGKLSDLVYHFLQVVAAKDRLGSLDAILAGSLLAVADSAGRVEVEAYVATAMDEATAARVAQRIGDSLGGKQVDLRQHVDESLIGGLKIKIGDKLIDASVASQLNHLKRNMMAGRRG